MPFVTEEIYSFMPGADRASRGAGAFREADER